MVSSVEIKIYITFKTGSYKFLSSQFQLVNMVSFQAHWHFWYFQVNTLFLFMLVRNNAI